jgi:hypothetical protein
LKKTSSMPGVNAAADQAADARDDSRLHRREWWKFVV